MDGMLLVYSVRRRERMVAFPFLERELETLYRAFQIFLKRKVGIWLLHTCEDFEEICYS